MLTRISDGGCKPPRGRFFLPFFREPGVEGRDGVAEHGRTEMVHTPTVTNLRASAEFPTLKPERSLRPMLIVRAAEKSEIFFSVRTAPSVGMNVIVFEKRF